ncbi:hypothetical protein DRQ29_03950 [bacterium]|nr:tetratricopeptide repeat protein [bacterium]RKZ27119.1 MAG: hypothetical protein DRQ29_03950 [bacterium]
MKYIKITILVSLVAMSAFLSGCFASKEEKMRNNAVPFYNEALEYFLNGKPDMAREKVLMAIDRYPTFVEAHILYQRIRAGKLETKELLKEYRRLMKENSNEPRYIYLYARLLDDFDEQERLYRKVIDLDSDCSWGYFGLGWVYYKTQRYPDAAEHFEQAVKLEPNNALFHLDLGAVYYLMQHNHDAEVELKKAVEILPRLVEGWSDLGAIYYQRAEFTKAVESLRKYLNLYPAAPDKNKIKKVVMQLSGGKI